MNPKDSPPALPASFVSHELLSDKLRQTSVLASLASAPYPTGTLAEAAFASYYATDYNRTMHILPTSLYTVPGYSPAPYVSPQEKTRQALMRKVSDLQEGLQIKDLEEREAELLVQMAQKDVRIEQLQRELYELQLLLHTCGICHTAFNHRNEKGEIIVNASKNATVCSARLGDSTCCAKLQKAQEVADRRAEQKETTRAASNEYESTGN